MATAHAKQMFILIFLYYFSSASTFLKSLCLFADQPMNAYSEGEGEGCEDEESVGDVEDANEDEEYDEFNPPLDSDSESDEEEETPGVEQVIKEWVTETPSLKHSHVDDLIRQVLITIIYQKLKNSEMIINLIPTKTSFVVPMRF